MEGPAGAESPSSCSASIAIAPRARSIQGIESARLDPAGYEGFEIRASVGGDKTALVLPDIATCPECLPTIRDPANRRYRYPFTNCTNCGPRFTIIQRAAVRPAAHHDGRRSRCARRAAREYEDPGDRRFHAQPNACPACGPHARAVGRGREPAWPRGDEALAAPRPIAFEQGEIVALKGLGGFHLVVDARNDGGACGGCGGASGARRSRSR